MIYFNEEENMCPFKKVQFFYLSFVVTCRPRMISENGHLFFSAGNNKDINFQTSGAGKIKVGDEDLTQQIHQVR